MEKIESKLAPKALGPYSQAMKVNGIVYISGQGGVNPNTGVLLEGIKMQAKQAMENISAILKEAGSDLSHVVKTTCFLHDIKDFGTFNEIYAQYFISKPARSCVSVKNLPANFLCEIEVIAEIKE